MNRVKASVWKSCLALLFLNLWTTSSHAATCRNPIPLLGGSTAIYRGPDIDTVPELQDALVRYKKAFRQILKEAGYSDSDYDEMVVKLGSLTEENIKPYGRGTQFEWMSYRRKSDKHVALLRKSCWEGVHDMRAWTFKLRVDEKDRTFLIPVTCLNLALLKGPPPTCSLTATVTCSSTEAPSTITVAATVSEETTIKDVAIMGTGPAGSGDSLTFKPTGRPYEWTLDASQSGSYSFTAVATDNREMKSSCKAQVAVCQKTPPYPCDNPPSCQLSATGSWPDDKQQGDLTINIAGSSGDRFAVDITGPEPGTIDPAHPDAPIHRSISQAGEYTVKLTASATNKKCKPAVCTSTVNIVKPPPPPPPLCCDSRWLLRTYAGWVESQGSEQTGLVRLANGNGNVGAFKFGFNEGLGFGLELERLFAHEGQPWNDAKWGWTFGLFRANVNTLWQVDITDQYWIRDKDRVPMLTLTTGLNYHWRGPKWDFFAGPVIGYAQFEDGTYADTSHKPGTFRANFDDNFTYGANLGFDGFLGKCWGITGGVEYLKVSTKAGFLDVDVDPLILKAGFVYHF